MIMRDNLESGNAASNELLGTESVRGTPVSHHTLPSQSD